MTVPAETPAPPKGGRAGRNLPAAIAVGLSLAALITVPLYTERVVFVGVVVVAMLVGIGELVRALRVAGIAVPVPPLAVGTVAMLAAAWTDGAEALVVGLLLTVVACMLWLALSPAGEPLRDLAGSAFAAVYVPFLAGFAILLTVPPDGPRRVTALIATVVCADVGGYAAGVLSGGRHKIAPSISPGKSWEGFAGSVAACMVAGVLFLTLLFDGTWWQGAVFGVAIALTAVIGDFGESLIKRDIGIKDMGNLLPGHGGLMDRLDSILPSAPVAWLLLGAFVPFTT